MAIIRWPRVVSCAPNPSTLREFNPASIDSVSALLLPLPPVPNNSLNAPVIGIILTTIIIILTTKADEVLEDQQECPPLPVQICLSIT